MQQLVAEFRASELVAQAVKGLGAQGVSEPDTQQLLGYATQAVHENVVERGPGPMGDHVGKSFFAGLAAGLVRGDGFFKSIVDGGEGVVSRRAAQSLATRAETDPSMAAAVAAAATPWILQFLKHRFGQSGSLEKGLRRIRPWTAAGASLGDQYSGLPASIVAGRIAKRIEQPDQNNSPQSGCCSSKPKTTLQRMTRTRISATLAFETHWPKSQR